MEFDVWTIVSAVFGLVAVVAGGFWAKGKGKVKAVANLLKEGYEVVAKINDVLADDKVEKSEVESLKKELNDVRIAFKVLIGKDQP